MSGDTTTLIRPSAVLAEGRAVAVIRALETLDVTTGGVWSATPGHWHRYDRPWDGHAGTPGSAIRIGTIRAMYGAPSRYDVTLFQVLLSPEATAAGWTADHLCDDALQHVGLTLASCPRNPEVSSIPAPFRMR